jgi:hypothetical protein
MARQITGVSHADQDEPIPPGGRLERENANALLGRVFEAALIARLLR